MVRAFQIGGKQGRRFPVRAAVLATATTLITAGGLTAEVRTIDGTGNNLANPTWGSAGTQLFRLTNAGYGDGASSLGGTGRPNPRAISNAIFAQPVLMPNAHAMSAMVFQWGQFIDHDLSLTPERSPAEPQDIGVPAGDPHFDPFNTGTATIGFNRSTYDPATGTSAANPRQQINVITSYLDGSMVYGSDNGRAGWLRSFDGGKLRVSTGNLLPFNDGTQDNGGGTGTNLFVAGDVRANEQLGLTAMHTVFVREHNRLADQLKTQNPLWGDEQIYQHARGLVGGLVQSITYNEFLPALMGPGALSDYMGYRPDANASVATEFSTALFRVGHTMLPDKLMRLDENWNEISQGHVSLRDAFFRPDKIVNEGGVEPVLRGLMKLSQQEIDCFVIDDVRNFLFGPPGAGGFDLASLNIQRGRDHGIGSYNEVRAAFGLSEVTSFSDITSNTIVAGLLQDLYGDVDLVDAWVGALSEEHLPGTSLGPLLFAGFKDQFERLRDGDRFWFEIDPNFTADEIAMLRGTTLADVIYRNTGIPDMPLDMFHVIPEPTSLLLLACGALTILRRRVA